MSITDELRECIDGLVMTSMSRDKMCAIANRIDAEHEKAIANVMNDALYHANEKDMAELGWIRLPKDADGVPIHVGDVMEMDDEPFEVRRIELDESGEWTMRDRMGVGHLYAHLYRHHHAPTVEDVLREFTDAILEWSRKSGSVAEVGTWSDVAAEYAAKLQLKEDK